jgi:mono/diheme cytochrome c family protein
MEDDAMHTRISRAKICGRKGTERFFTYALSPGFAAVLALICLFSLTCNLAASLLPRPPAAPEPTPAASALAKSLGISFIPGSSSAFLMERNGKTYKVDLAERTIQVSESVSPVAAQAAPSLVAAHSSSNDAPSGAKIFSDKCATCHGPEGKGGGPLKTPDFTNPSAQAGLPRGTVVKTIRNGKPGTAMPAWAGKLSDAEIEAVADFVKSLGAGSKSSAGSAGSQ